MVARAAVRGGRPRLAGLVLAAVVALSPGCLHRPVETGLASWYGPGFAGRPTASGRPFRPWRRSAAHRTLPFGTVVVVRRLDTGQRVRVVIDDRGPYVEGRIIDLSRRAARRIDLLEVGVAPVEVRVVGCRRRLGDCRGVRRGRGRRPSR